MSDIVDRLRQMYLDTGANNVQEAADTIDSLRMECARMKEMCERYEKMVGWANEVLK